MYQLHGRVVLKSPARLELECCLNLLGAATTSRLIGADSDDSVSPRD